MKTISIKAMMVGKLHSGQKFANISNDFKRVMINPLGAHISSDKMGTAENMASGIHLHWILPDELRKGEQNENGGIDYPELPNRYIVIRLWQEGTEIKSRAFLIESDALSKTCSVENYNLGSPSLLYLEDMRRPFRYLGRSFPFEMHKKITGPDGVLESLTAGGTGNPVYTAYYPDCRNVFAFYDDMTDENGREIVNSDVHYAVIGIYLKDRIISEELYCGMLCGLNWTDKNRLYPLAIPEKADVAVGNTSAEALSVLTAKWAGRRKYERVMHHLLDENLYTLSESNGITKSEKKLHELRFGNESKENLFYVKPADKDAAQKEIKDTDKLYAINKISKEILLEEARLNWEQEAVYDTWYKYVSVYNEGDKIMKKILPKYQKRIEELGESIISHCANICELRKEHSEMLSSFSEKLTGEFSLTNGGGQRFWEANEPVLMINGIGRDDFYGFGNEAMENPDKRIMDKATEEIKKCLKDLGFKGVFAEDISSYAIQWEVPWYPLYIAWKAFYYPDDRMAGSSPSLKNWEFHDYDYVFKGRMPAADKAVSFSGLNVITPHAAKQLEYAADSDLNMELGDVDVLSQKLNGFNELFFMRDYYIKLPIFEFAAENKKLAEQVRALLDGYDYEHPKFDMEKMYSPFRSGFLGLERIHIIDSFGQLLDFKPDRVLVSQNLRKDESISQKLVMLPPRFMQLTRLSLEWEREPSGDVYICGILLPDFIDCSLSVYNGKGEVLGSLQQVGFEEKIVWKAPPERGGGTEPLPKDIDKDLYAFLYKFLDGKNKNLLVEFLDYTDTALFEINPGSAQIYDSMSALLMRPLVLVGAKIRLEQDLPQRPIKYFEKSPTDEGPQDLVKVENLSVPVFVGERGNFDDGVIGFYVMHNFEKIYMSAGQAPQNEYFIHDNSLNLSAKWEGSETEIMFLMDPMGEVNIRSGFLPVKTSKLEAGFVESMLQKVNHTFFAAPVLTEIANISVPYPEIENMRCSWIHSIDKTQWSENEKLRHTDEKAFFNGNQKEFEEGWIRFERLTR